MMGGWRGGYASTSGITATTTFGHNPGYMCGGFMYTEGYHEQMHAAMANTLGMTAEELDAAMGNGQTMYQIAEAQGVDFADLWAAMNTLRREIFQQALEDGSFTQEQADWMGGRWANRGIGHRGMFGPMGTYGGCFAQPGTTN